MIINLQRNHAIRFIKFNIIIQTNNLPRVFFVIYQTKRQNSWELKIMNECKRKASLQAKPSLISNNFYFFRLNFSLHHIIKCSNSCLVDCLRAFRSSFLKIRGSKQTFSKIIFAYSIGLVWGFFMWHEIYHKAKRQP